MDQKSILTLKNNNLLKNVNIGDLKIGSSIGRLKTLNGGDVLYRSGDKANSIYLLLNGEVNLVKKKKNGECESVVFSDNDFFGAKELFSKIDRCTTTVSLTDSSLIELTKEEVDFLTTQNDEFALNIQKGNRDFSFDDNLIDVTINKSEEKIPEDFISEKEIDEIINSIEEQEEQIVGNNSELSIEEINSRFLNFKEIIGKDEKNNYNCKKNVNIIPENKMTSKQNQEKANYMSSEQFEMVIKSLQLVNANVKQDDVLTNIVDVVVNLTNADRGTLYLVDKIDNTIWSKVFIGGTEEEIRLKIGEGLAGWVAENGITLSVPDVTKDSRFDGSIDAATGYKTHDMLIFPIKNKNEEIVGVLQLLNSLKGGFTEQEEMFLNAISLNIALALENASLVEKLISAERNVSIEKMGNFLAYDLKRPILSSKRYAEHLLKKELPFDVKQVAKLLAEQLDQVASQLTTASDFTEGTTLLRKLPMGLNDTLRDFSNRIHNYIKLNNCKIEHDFTDDVQINVDKKEFYQCYYNIVKNACEALSGGGTVLISTLKDGKNIIINFNDKGVGIEPTDIGLVFEPLWTKNKQKNSGLGLSISKKIVEDHGGTISIQSSKKEGTTVTIALPIH